MDGSRESCLDDSADQSKNHAFCFDRDTGDRKSHVSLQSGPMDGSRRRCSERRRELSKSRAFCSASMIVVAGSPIDHAIKYTRPLKKPRENSLWAFLMVG